MEKARAEAAAAKQAEEKQRQAGQQYLEEREMLIGHMAMLETDKLNPEVRDFQSAREKVMGSELQRMRSQLAKERSQREQELLAEVEELREVKFKCESEARSAHIAR